jgi:hypothetical protein
VTTLEGTVARVPAPFVFNHLQSAGGIASSQRPPDAGSGSPIVRQRVYAAMKMIRESRPSPFAIG